MIRELPRIDRTDRLLSELDYYGFYQIITQYCGRSIPYTEHDPKVIWQHGWVPDSKQHHPRAVLTSMVEDPETVFLVCRKSEVNYLRSFGYNNVKSVGSPLIYVKKKSYERKSGSLLVMPLHSLQSTKHDHWDFKSYVQYIESIKSKFSSICICIHPSCIEKGYWINDFKSRGFEIIEGVDVFDRNSMNRLQVLFSTFEYVTTNGFGSHIAYASYFGAKVSIAGPLVEYKTEDYQNNTFYKKYPDTLEIAVDFSRKENLRMNFSMFFKSPELANQQISWAKNQLGENNKLTAREFRRLLGWDRISTLKRFLRKIKSRTSTKIRRFFSLLIPKEVLHIYRLQKYPEYKVKIKTENEVNRLKALPRYEETTTDLLGMRLRLPDSASFLALKAEIFDSEIYKCNFSSSSPLIIDAGANIGLSVIYFKNRYPESKIIAFEPDPKIFEILKENTSSFGLHDVCLINKGLWNEETLIPFHQEGADSGHILDKSSEAEIQIETTRLKTHLNQKVDFLKIDIEGAEVKVLEDSKDYLNNVERIFVEYHSYKSEKQELHKVIELLDNAGFRLHIHSPSIVSTQPLFSHEVYQGMDMMINIFGYKK